MVLEKTLQSPLDCKEIKPVNPKENQPWTFIGKTDAEAPILWPPDSKSWLTGKDLDAGKNWGQEKGAIEGEMGGWHHWLNGHKFELILEMPKDREAWHAAVHGVTKSRTWLSDWITMILKNTGGSQTYWPSSWLIRTEDWINHDTLMCYNWLGPAQERLRADC